MRSKVLSLLVDRIQRTDEDSPLHRMLITHGDRPVYVRTAHMTRDFWWVEIEVRVPPPVQQEESELDYHTVLNMAYLKGSGRRIRP